jgi:hypothetical protein
VKTPKFESLSLDAGLNLLQSKVATFSRQKLSALFGSIGVAMLPSYAQFSERNHWGDALVLREALDIALGYAVGESNLHGKAGPILMSIAAIIPSEEEFEVPESTFAMDAAICVDAAIRAADPEYKVEPAWIEYALNPVITVLCEQQTGYLDLGSSPEADVWQADALRNPELKGAFEALDEMVEILSSIDRPVSTELLEILKTLACRLVPRRLSII